MRQIFSVLWMTCIFSIAAMSQDTVRKNLIPLGSQPVVNRSFDAPVEATDEFVIGPEDILSIVVWREPDLTNNKVIVRPDGKIGVPLLNDVQASGLTPLQLQARLTEELKRFITAPEISVIVQEIHSQNVYITGAVARPGAYPLGGPTTVMELLVRAGGLAEFAKSDDIQILRRDGGKPRRLRFNYKLFSEGKDYQQNIRVRNGDMIIVP